MRGEGVRPCPGLFGFVVCGRPASVSYLDYIVGVTSVVLLSDLEGIARRLFVHPGARTVLDPVSAVRSKVVVSEHGIAAAEMAASARMICPLACERADYLVSTLSPVGQRQPRRLSTYSAVGLPIFCCVHSLTRTRRF